MEAEFKESYWIRKQTYPVSKIPKLRKRPQANQSCGYLTSGRWNLIRFSQTDKELLITLRALPYNIPFSSAQSLCRVRLFVTPWTAARQASLSSTNGSLLRLMPIELVMPSNHLILCHPLLLLHSIFPSIRVFSNESVLRIRWPKDWSFSFSISPSNAYSELISFTIDWLDLLVVQGTLKSLIQYHSSNASILQCSAFFMVQLSHLHMTSGKTIGLTRWIFVSKIMSLLCNMLSRLVMGFPCGLAGKESTCNAGDLGLIPGLGRSPGEGKDYPLHYSGLENSMN